MPNDCGTTLALHDKAWSTPHDSSGPNGLPLHACARESRSRWFSKLHSPCATRRSLSVIRFMGSDFVCRVVRMTEPGAPSASRCGRAGRAREPRHAGRRRRTRRGTLQRRSGRVHLAQDLLRDEGTTELVVGIAAAYTDEHPLDLALRETLPASGEQALDAEERIVLPARVPGPLTMDASSDIVDAARTNPSYATESAELPLFTAPGGVEQTSASTS